MSTFLNRNPYRRARRASVTAGFDPVLTGAVALLLVIGTLLVYAATREWYSANGLDQQYYLKRHVINIVYRDAAREISAQRRQVLAKDRTELLWCHDALSA